MKYSEIAEQVMGVQAQLRGMLASTNAILRSIEPMVAAEQKADKAPVPPRRFGQPREE